MVKKEIVSKVAEETGYSHKTVNEVIDSLLNNITSEISNGNKVQFVGFGVFEPKERAARTGRNPKTNQPIQIPKRIVPSFKPGSRLIEATIRGEC